MPIRVVIDTNILIGAAYAAQSASRRVVDACLGGQLFAIISPVLRKESEYIVPRAIRGHCYDAEICRLLKEAERAESNVARRIVLGDPADDKLVATATAGKAAALITNDRNLLCLDPNGDLRIVRPAEFVRQWLDR